MPDLSNGVEGPPALAVEPDEIEAAAVALFDASAGLYEDFKLVSDAASGLETSLDLGQFKGVAEVSQAVAFWETEVVAGLRTRVEEIAAFLAAYAVQHVELDQFTSDTFSRLADPSLFPVDPSTRTTPVPKAPAPEPTTPFYDSPGGGMQYTE